MTATLSFKIFPFGHREWCAQRADGLVCGYFLNQADAVRFARWETCEAGTIKIGDIPLEAAHLRTAA